MGATASHVVWEPSRTSTKAHVNRVHLAPSQMELGCANHVVWARRQMQGTTCLSSYGCLQRNDCTACNTGYMSPGATAGPCIQCSEPGKRANDGQTGCEQCPAGMEPSIDQSQCIRCAANNFSTFGIACQVCEVPAVVNDAHTTCSPCQAGTGPNVNRTSCLPCVGNRFSTVGVCQLCSAGSAASTDKIRCDDISQSDLRDVLTVADAIRSSDLDPIVTLNATVQDTDALIDGSPAQVRFMHGLKQDLVASLMVDASTISVSSLRQVVATLGRRRTQAAATATLVSFEVRISGEDAAAILTELSAQLADPTSMLRNSPTAGLIDVSDPPEYSLVCPAGQIRAFGGAQCSSCGTSSVPSPAGDACDECPTNQHADDTGISCTCEAGYYNSSAVLPVCFQGDFADAVSVAASTATSLVCRPCGSLPCIDECQGAQLKVRAGWSPPSTELRRSTSLAVFQCKNPDACLGGQPGVTITNVTSCQRGYTHPLCGVCTTGYALTPDGTCEQCAEMGLQALIATIVGALVGCLVLATLIERCYVHAVGLQAFMSAVDELHIPAIVKMVVATCQILGNLTSVLKIQLPETFTRLIRAFVSVFRFDILSMLSLGCLSDGSFSASLLASVLFVAVIAVTVLLLYLYERHQAKWLNHIDSDDGDFASAKVEAHLRELFEEFDTDGTGIELTELQAMVRKINSNTSDEEAHALFQAVDTDGTGTIDFDEFHKAVAAKTRHRHLRRNPLDLKTLVKRKEHAKIRAKADGRLFLLIFLIYPGLTNKIFEGFSCRAIGESASIMESDYAVSCESTEYESIRRMCLLLTLLWPVGVPSYLLWSMGRVRSKILDDDTDTMRKYRFALGDYDRQHWYWEVVELSRKLVLSGFIGLFQKGSIAQVFVATLISFLFFAATVREQPFGQQRLNIIKTFSEFQVFGVLLVFFFLLLHAESSTIHRCHTKLRSFPVGMKLTLWHSCCLDRTCSSSYALT